jgi:hypothetical protein
MTIQSFIEKAIEGGWSPYARNVVAHELPLEQAVKAMRRSTRDAEILLDPLAWKAVGKVEGWPDEHWQGIYREYAEKNAIARMHRMIDALAEGKTIEQYLETL